MHWVGVTAAACADGAAELRRLVSGQLPQRVGGYVRASGRHAAWGVVWGAPAQRRLLPYIRTCPRGSSPQGAISHII
eukprot:3181805-Pleurochrysis_carterae.AAC.1